LTINVASSSDERGIILRLINIFSEFMENRLFVVAKNAGLPQLPVGLLLSGLCDEQSLIAGEITSI